MATAPPAVEPASAMHWPSRRSTQPSRALRRLVRRRDRSAGLATHIGDDAVLEERLHAPRGRSKR